MVVVNFVVDPASSPDQGQICQHCAKSERSPALHTQLPSVIITFTVDWVICIGSPSLYGGVGRLWAVNGSVLNAWSRWRGAIHQRPQHLCSLKLSPGYRQPVIDRTMLFEHRLQSPEWHWLRDLWSVAFDGFCLSLFHLHLLLLFFLHLLILLRLLLGRGNWGGTFRSEPSWMEN